MGDIFDTKKKMNKIGMSGKKSAEREKKCYEGRFFQ